MHDPIISKIRTYVEAVVGGAVSGFGHSASKENAEDLVGPLVGVILIEGQEDQGSVHKVGIVQ